MIGALVATTAKEHNEAQSPARGASRSPRRTRQALDDPARSRAALVAAPDTETNIGATGLAPGVLLNGNVIRALIVLAVVSLMGRWNCWLPRWPARLLRLAPSLPARALRTEAG
jgi:RND superfamily putative drug exporter